MVLQGIIRRSKYSLLCHQVVGASIDRVHQVDGLFMIIAISVSDRRWRNRSFEGKKS